jgi:hypothetical protein
MLQFTIRLVLLAGFVVGPVAVLAVPPGETAAPAANTWWEEIGVGSATGRGISNDLYSSYNPSLAVGPDGEPIVAWENWGGQSGRWEIHVRRWNGSAWVEMGAGSASGGGISHASGDSVNASLAVGPDGLPVVAWQDNSSGQREIYVRRWNGSAWVELGAGSASGDGISHTSDQAEQPALAIGSNGLPVVAWADYGSGNSEIYVRQWNGSTWQEVGVGSASGGGISQTEGPSHEPAIAIGLDNAPVVVWENYFLWSGRGEIYVRRWTGLVWSEMAGSASGGGISDTANEWSSSPSVAIDLNSAAVVTWNEWNASTYVRTYARRWNGLAWVEMGGSASASGIGGDSSSTSSVAIGPDNAPVVAWEDRTNGYEIYVRRWSGSAWVEVGQGSASDGGISNDSRTSQSPVLAIGRNGNPIVAWANNSDDDAEIYLRRYAPKLAYVPLTVVLSCWPNAGESEPNNNTVQANGPICPGRAYAGLPDDRYDVFYLNAAAGPISINLANHIGRGVQLQLHHERITSSPMAIDYTGADGYRLNVPNAPAGRYYVVISTQAPDSGATTRYTLTPTFTLSD